MKLLGLLRQPENLIANLVLARGPREITTSGRNYHLPPLLYINDPRSQEGSLSSLMSIFTLLSWAHSLWVFVHLRCLLPLCCLAESSPQQLHTAGGNKAVVEIFIILWCNSCIHVILEPLAIVFVLIRKNLTIYKWLSYDIWKAKLKGNTICLLHAWEISKNIITSIVLIFRIQVGVW